MGDVFHELGQLGIMLLLFVVGLQVETGKLKELSGNIVALTILNLSLSSVFGSLVLMSYGYPALISALVATALATVAEATVAPILDELGIIKTKIANLILGAGIMDDVAEVGIASLASVIVGGSATTQSSTLGIGIAVMVALALAFYKLLVPIICRRNTEQNGVQLFLLMCGTLLLFTGFSKAFGLGVLFGAIAAGMVLQKLLRETCNGEKGLTVLRVMAYGLLGPVFFFEIGYSVGVRGLSSTVTLTGLLLAANFLGKFLAVLILRHVVQLSWREIVVVGLGLSTKFSMGIIPVQIFYSAKVIDQDVFSSFVAVSAITTMTIPFVLASVLSRWKDRLA
jgi:Ca2+-transporting ATPase